MANKLLIGWSINSLCMIHLLTKFKGGNLSKIIALSILLIPYLGLIIYLIMFVWDVPPPQPYHLRQNKMNHYGRAEFGENTYHYESSDTRLLNRITYKKDNILEPGKKIVLAARTAIVAVGLVIIFLSVGAIYSGTWSYSNWWGDPVFGPIGVVIGSLFIYIVVYKWDKF